MKKIYMSLAGLVMAVNLIAQSQYMPISVIVEEVQEPFPANAKVQIQNKLTQLISQNGIASIEGNNQFVLTCFAVPQDKDILAGPPSQIVETMEMTFYIADIKSQTIFATTSHTVKGVGRTEARAYMDAIKNIPTTGAKMEQFVKEGQKKIVEYYDAEAPMIIKKALALSEAHQYQEALHMIMCIPSQCQSFDLALETGKTIFHQYQDYTCNKNLQLARMAWAAEQNATGAVKAGEYLAEIYPDAACYNDAMSLYTEVKGKVLDDWRFEMKQYQDSVDIEKQRIDAMRQIGVEYGKHQQPVTTNIGFLRGL